MLKSIQQGEIIEEFNFVSGEMERACNSSGSLATWITQKIDLLEKKDQLIDALFRKLNSDNQNSEDYVFEYFKSIVFDPSITLQSWQIDMIKKKLNTGDERFYKALSVIMKIESESEWSKLFRTEFDAFNSAETSESKLPL